MISLVVPVYNEADNIQLFLRDVESAVSEPHEVLIVYDFPEDNTLAAVAALTPPCPSVRLIHNILGRGVLNAIKAGFQASTGEVVIVMMADRSDDPHAVMPMAQLVRDGADVVAGSRYVRGGRQEGGPLLKRTLSRLAGMSLHYLAGLPIHDATNNFRAYSRRVIEQIPIEGEASFAIALELTLKAHWRGWRLAEVPTTWRDRTAGESRFRLWAWMPHYLRWYLRAFAHAWLGGEKKKILPLPRWREAMNLARLLMRLLLGRRLPLTQGTLRLPGLHGHLRIHRDRWGIPYIDADNELDAYFGIGFCHGQDRAFQLEILLRVARGTLCEMVGRAALPVDRLSRRIGFHRSAVLQEPIINAKVRATIEAYAHGVNAGRTQGLPRRPHEFVLLRSQPTPWTPFDSLALVKLISFSLASNWDIELARLKVLLEDGADALTALDPAYPLWLPTTAPPGKAAGPAVDRLAEELKSFTAVMGLGGGSNNWTVAADRTATGRPILANDPHLDSRLPPHWYLIQARTPQWAVAGATFLGGPAVQAGHNGHAAWGVTAGMIDNTDLFREQIGPDGRSMRQGDGYAPCEVREEVIAIKGESSVTEQVLITPRGPILSPALRGTSEALSLRAVWLDPHPLDGLLHLHRVRSFEEFHKAAEHWPAASWNMVYADQTGTIGWQMFGQAPKRRSGWGLIPAPGWNPQAGWEPDLVPFEELPHAVNPPEGFVATANNQPLPDGVGPFLGLDWLDGYRAASIARELSARADWDVPRTLALQMNQRAVAWDDLRDAVLSAPDGTADTRQALEMLRGWDGRVAVDSSAATVYELFLAEMAGRVARAKAPRSFAYVLGEPLGPITPYNFLCYRRTGHLARLLREQPTGWFSRPWCDEIADALATVIRRLRTEQGGDATGWAFGRLRTLTLHHPLGRKRWLSPVFNLGPIPYGGDADTINQGAVLPLDPLASVDNIASLRVVIDVGAWNNSRFSLPGGQSGNPLSPHYDDLFALWQRGEGVPIAWTAEEIRQVTIKTLELSPL